MKRAVAAGASHFELAGGQSLQQRQRGCVTVRRYLMQRPEQLLAGKKPIRLEAGRVLIQVHAL